ncbi:MAG: hypothetical protein AB1394_14880 [Bacteroidota bacterium]
METKNLEIKIDGKIVVLKAKLRSEITGEDWERWQRLDDFYSKIDKDGEKNTQLFLKMNREEYNTLVQDVLVNEDNELLPVDVIKRIPITVSLPMVVDFFFVYNQLNNDISKSLEKSGANSMRSIGTSKDLKTT